MGHAEAIARMNGVHTKSEKFGVSATYTPPDSVAFSCSVIVGRVSLEDVDPRVVRDLQECQILHSSFVAGGISKATFWRERQTGDMVTIKNLEGEDEDWKVIDGSRDNYGKWTLIIERNTRVTP